MSIRLPKGEWNIDYDRQLGHAGGFGAVFAGGRDGYPPLAIKKLKLTAKEAANRELRMAERLAAGDHKHVMQVFDYGQDADSDHYFIVMPQAEGNLREHIQGHNAIPVAEAAGILLEIIDGLEEVDEIVHRDLKPENILLHEGAWKLADFGIAKFVEESTSRQTMKGFWTPAYAAPEQWKANAVSAATDLYAFGCIAYELVTGSPPFIGPQVDDYQLQHVSGPIPALDCGNPQFSSLVSMLLRKPPESRPTRGRVRTILTAILTPREEAQESAARKNLASIGAREVARLAEQERQHEEKRLFEENRQALAEAAFPILVSLREKLFDDVKAYAEPARRKGDSISLGDATLTFKIDTKRVFLHNWFADVGWDVISGALIMVFQAAPRKYTRSASIWYMNKGSDQPFRWQEASYWASDSIQYYEDATPFGFDEPEHAARAHGRARGRFAVATQPRPVDDEAAADFAERWIQILVTAYEGKLAKPARLPID